MTDIRPLKIKPIAGSEAGLMEFEAGDTIPASILNIVGSVADGAIIEGGTVAYASAAAAAGDYVMLADGTMFAALSIVVTDQALSDAYGSLYQGVRNWTFPKPFKAGTLPCVIAGSFRWGTGAGWAAVRQVNDNASASLRGFDIASRPVGTAVNITAFAMGKWK